MCAMSLSWLRGGWRNIENRATALPDFHHTDRGQLRFQVVEQTPSLEQRPARFANNNSTPDFTQCRCLLEDIDIKPRLLKSNCCRCATDTRADDSNVNVLLA